MNATYTPGRLQRRIVSILNRKGPITIAKLRSHLKVRRGPHAMTVVDHGATVRGLSRELGNAIVVLIRTDRVRFTAGRNRRLHLEAVR